MTTGRTTGDEGVRCVAGRAEGLRARVLSRRALRYATGANAEEDIPAHVRAGSALAITDDAMLVAHAVWAARRLGHEDLVAAVAEHPDPQVQAELRAAVTP